MTTTRKTLITNLLASIILCQTAGFIGAFFTTPSIPTWYASLNKPSFTPPNWVFAPVWITLFTMMGAALSLVWNKRQYNQKVNPALTAFALQLTLNTLWSIVFFGFHSPLGGLIVITLLWFAITLTTVRFHKVSLTAAVLLVPYLMWVSFAAILNLMILLMNP